MRNKQVCNDRSGERGGVAFLVFMAIMLASATMMSAALLENIPSTENRQEQTEEKMAQVMKAFSVYSQRYNRLPCPADPNTTPAGGEPFGSERNSTGGTGLGNCAAAAQAEGIIPFRTLGLQEEDVRDAWGNYVTYRVSPVFTQSPSDSLRMAHQTCRAAGRWFSAGLVIGGGGGNVSVGGTGASFDLRNFSSILMGGGGGGNVHLSQTGAVTTIEDNGDVVIGPDANNITGGTGANLSIRRNGDVTIAGTGVVTLGATGGTTNIRDNGVIQIGRNDATSVSLGTGANMNMINNDNISIESSGLVSLGVGSTFTADNNRRFLVTGGSRNVGTATGSTVNITRNEAVTFVPGGPISTGTGSNVTVQSNPAVIFGGYGDIQTGTGSTLRVENVIQGGVGDAIMPASGNPADITMAGSGTYSPGVGATTTLSGFSGSIGSSGNGDLRSGTGASMHFTGTAVNNYFPPDITVTTVGGPLAYHSDGTSYGVGVGGVTSGSEEIRFGFASPDYGANLILSGLTSVEAGDTIDVTLVLSDASTVNQTITLPDPIPADGMFPYNLSAALPIAEVRMSSALVSFGVNAMASSNGGGGGGSGGNLNPIKARFCCPDGMGLASFDPTTDIIVQDAAANVLTPAARVTTGYDDVDIPAGGGMLGAAFDVAAIALISHGANGEQAAFRPDGTRPTAAEQASMGVAERANADGTPTIVQSLEVGVDTNNQYDDIVLWRTQNQLYSETGRGSCSTAI